MCDNELLFELVQARPRLYDAGLVNHNRDMKNTN